MQVGVFGRFLSISVSICLTLFIGLVVAIQWSSYRAAENSLIEKMDSISAAYALIFSESMARKRYDQIELTSVALLLDEDVSGFLIYDADGVELESFGDLKFDEQSRFAKSVVIRYADEFGVQNLGVLKIAMSLDAIENHTIGQTRFVVLMAGGLLLAALASAVWAYWRAVGIPLGRLSAEIKRFQKKNRHKDVPVHSHDQLGMVIQEYNRMQRIAEKQKTHLLVYQGGLEQKVVQREQQLEQELLSHANTTKRLAYMADHDSLTELPNRRAFQERVRMWMIDLDKSDEYGAICFLDLDRFKIINDASGYHAGDLFLTSVAKLLQLSIRDSDYLARFGGDEFVLFMPDVDIGEAAKACQKLIEIVADHRFSWDGQSFGVSLSIGLSTVDRNSPGFDQVLINTDLACYKAKKNGGNQLHIHSSEDDDLSKHYEDVFWATEVDKAIAENRFELWAQKIEPFSENDSESWWELLLRYRAPSGEVSTPEGLLQATERFGIVEKIDRWVLDQMIELLNSGSRRLPDRFSVNISGQSISSPNFVSYVEQQVRQKVVHPERICFEITETTYVSDYETVKGFMSRMSELGCMFALDDFGTGASSFEYLKNLNFDVLKIDGSYIQKLDQKGADFEIVKSMKAIAATLGMKTVAEFVETEFVRGLMEEIGIEYIQGHFMEKPRPILL